jgi:hypothetical protein
MIYSNSCVKNELNVRPEEEQTKHKTIRKERKLNMKRTIGWHCAAI